MLLFLASKKPETNEKVARFLENTIHAILAVENLDVEAKEKDTSRTAILCAAAMGNDGLVRALLSRSNGKPADIYAVNNRYVRVHCR